MENKITPQNKLKFVLGVCIPLFLLSLTIGFVLLMLGYNLGTQDNTDPTSWNLVIPGWILLGIGLIGYFSLFIYVNIKRYKGKIKQEVKVD